jgi:hypothetical protein
MKTCECLGRVHVAIIVVRYPAAKFHLNCRRGLEPKIARRLTHGTSPGDATKFRDRAPAHGWHFHPSRLPNILVLACTPGRYDLPGP